MFALRFHPSSPITGNDSIYLIFCLFLIFIVLITAQIHNSNILFLEGFSISLWVMWHLSSQIYAENLTGISMILVLFGVSLFTLLFLIIAYIRKDIVLVCTIQLVTLLMLFLPNSSELLAFHYIIEDLNYSYALLILLTIIYFIIAFIFPSKKSLTNAL